MPINRAGCIRRYMELQDEARRLMPRVRTPHITSKMSDAEIVQLGKWLADIVKKLKEVQEKQ